MLPRGTKSTLLTHIPPILPPIGGFIDQCPFGINPMTFSQVLIDTTGIDQLAAGMLGFSDESQEISSEVMTSTLFLNSGSSNSNGRCAYLLMEDGSKLWVPNSLTCCLVHVSIITQTYENFEPAQKLHIRVIASDGSSYIYRCGLGSWAASSFLRCFSNLSKEQLAEPIQITLTAKGRATFATVAYKDGDSFKRVTIAKEQLGKKVSYDLALDVISYLNDTSDTNQAAYAMKQQVEAAVTNDVEPFEVATPELDHLLKEIREPQKLVSKRGSKKPVASSAA